MKRFWQFVYANELYFGVRLAALGQVIVSAGWRWNANALVRLRKLWPEPSQNTVDGE